MAVRIKVELNSPGIKELLNSAEVAGELERRGVRVVAAAKGASGIPSGLRKEWVESVRGKVEHTDRAVYTIGTYSGLKRLAITTGALTKALDAAGGA